MYRKNGSLPLSASTTSLWPKTRVLLHKNFSSWLALSVILPALSRIVHAPDTRQRHITAYVNSSFKSVIKSSFYSLIVFRRFLTWITLSDVDLRLSLTFVRTAYAV
jgi:hypothetical protein